MKRFYLICLILALLPIHSDAQLHFKNPSFEALGFVPDMSKFQYYIPGWLYCQDPLYFNEKGYKWYDSSIYTPQVVGRATEGFYFLGLIARSYDNVQGKVYYPDAIRETISTSLKCGYMLKGLRYTMSLDIKRDYNPDFGDPYLYIFTSNDTCDTSTVIYETYVKDTGWSKANFSFIVRENFNHLSIRCRHMYKDTTTIKGRNYVFMYLDNLSSVTPDTAYNSEHFPITVQAKGLGKHSLKSPYMGEQYWYADGKLLGSGDSIELSVLKPTTITLTLGKDSCIPSVLQTTIVPTGDTNRIEGLIFPTAFTPNGDARNAVFRVIQNAGLVGLQQYELSVYNRWGQRLWQSTDPMQGWTGADAGIGVYFWLCRYTLPNGSRQEQKGDVTLLK